MIIVYHRVHKEYTLLQYDNSMKASCTPPPPLKYWGAFAFWMVFQKSITACPLLPLKTFISPCF